MPAKLTPGTTCSTPPNSTLLTNSLPRRATKPTSRASSLPIRTSSLRGASSSSSSSTATSSNTVSQVIPYCSIPSRSLVAWFKRSGQCQVGLAYHDTHLSSSFISVERHLHPLLSQPIIYLHPSQRSTTTSITTTTETTAMATTAAATTTLMETTRPHTETTTPPEETTAATRMAVTKRSRTVVTSLRFKVALSSTGHRTRTRTLEVVDRVDRTVSDTRAGRQPKDGVAEN